MLRATAANSQPQTHATRRIRLLLPLVVRLDIDLQPAKPGVVSSCEVCDLTPIPRAGEFALSGVLALGRGLLPMRSGGDTSELDGFLPFQAASLDFPILLCYSSSLKCHNLEQITNMSTSQVLPAVAAAVHEPGFPVDFVADQPDNPWLIRSGTQRAEVPEGPLSLSSLRSRPRGTTNDASDTQQSQRPLPRRQRTGTPVMEDMDDDTPASGSAPVSDSYLDAVPHIPRSVKRPRPVKSCLECR